MGRHGVQEERRRGGDSCREGRRKAARHSPEEEASAQISPRWPSSMGRAPQVPAAARSITRDVLEPGAQSPAPAAMVRCSLSRAPHLHTGLLGPEGLVVH